MDISVFIIWLWLFSFSNLELGCDGIGTGDLVEVSFRKFVSERCSGWAAVSFSSLCGSCFGGWLNFKGRSFASAAVSTVFIHVSRAFW